MAKRIILGILLAVLAASVNAQTTRYISDQLSVTLRSGESLRHQILRNLQSGTPVEVLETNPESGYSRVRAPDGTEGWVISRFLMNQPSARQRLEEAEERVVNLETENKRLNEQVTKLDKQRETLETSLQELKQDKQRLSQELNQIKETAADVLAIEKENKRLSQRIVNLETELQGLQQENAALQDRNDRNWFMTGAGVLVLGLVLGLVLPNLKLRRRSRWDTL